MTIQKDCSRNNRRQKDCRRNDYRQKDMLPAKGLGIPACSIVVPLGLGPNLQFNAINFDVRPSPATSNLVTLLFTWGTFTSIMI